MGRTPLETWARRVERWQSSELTAKEFAAHARADALADSHWVATVLVPLANELLVVIAAYRNALDREHQGRRRQRDDYPF